MDLDDGDRIEVEVHTGSSSLSVRFNDAEAVLISSIMLFRSLPMLSNRSETFSAI